LNRALAAWALLLAPLALGAAEPLRIAGSAGLGDAPTKVAAALGLFAPQTPSQAPIEITVASSGKQALERLLHGEADVALAAPTPIAQAILDTAGADPERRLVVLASVSLTTRAHSVVAWRNRGIERPSGLADRRVGVMFGTSAHFGWSRFAAFHGIDAEAVTLVDVAIDRQQDALLAGRVDAVVTWEPYASHIRGALGDDGVAFSTRRLYGLDWLLATRRATLERRPQEVERVLAAYREAIELLRREPERARALHAAQTELAPELLARAEQDIIFRLTLDWAVVASLEAQLAWLRERAGTEGPPPHPRDYLAPGPLLRIAPSRVGLPPSLLPGTARSGS